MAAGETNPFGGGDLPHSSTVLGAMNFDQIMRDATSNTQQFLKLWDGFTTSLSKRFSPTLGAVAARMSSVNAGVGGGSGGTGWGGSGGSYINAGTISTPGPGNPAPPSPATGEAAPPGNGGIFRRMSGWFDPGGAGGGIRYLAAREAAQAITRTTSGPYNYYNQTAASYGYNRSYLAIQMASYSGTPYQGGGSSFYNAGRSQVKGLVGAVHGGWTDLNDLYGAASNLRTTAGTNYSTGLMQQVGALSGFAPALGGMQGTAAFYNKLMSPGMVNQLQPYGGGLVGSGGSLRSPTATLDQLVRIASGGSTAAWGSGAMGRQSLQATFAGNGKGRANLSYLGFSAEEIGVAADYAQARLSGRGLTLPKKSYAAFQTQLSEAQGRTKDTAFNRTEADMADMDAILIKLNASLKEMQKSFGGLGFGVGQLGKGISTATNAIVEFAAAKWALGALTGGGGNAAGAGAALGLGGLGATLGLAAGAGLGGMAAGALAGHFTHGNKLAKFGAGAAAGAAMTAWLGPETFGLATLAGAGIGGVLGMMGDPLPGGGNSAGLSPGFEKSLEAMFAANPRLSLTSGYRTSAQQAALYAANPGLAAPPGSSLHEKGLAADIGPPSEYGWIAANAAKYGLALPMPGKEPWHVQPQNARQTSGAAVVMEEGGAQSGGQGLGGWSPGLRFKGSSAGVLAQMSAMGAMPGSGFAGLSSGSSTPVSGATSSSVGGGGGLTAAQIVQDARAAGFSGSALRTASAIALAESHGNASAHNNTGPDDSYGLWQVNYKGTLRAGRTAQFGAPEGLYDPMANARAAFSISGGGQNFSAWSTYKNNAYKSYLGAVDAAMGDPIRGGGGGVVSMGGSTTVHVHAVHMRVKLDQVNEQEVDRLYQAFVGRMQSTANDAKVGMV